MKAVLSTAVAVMAGLALPNAAEAAIINGGFENGFASWQTLGDYEIVTSAFRSGPVKGENQAFLSTAFNEVVGVDAQGNEIVGGNAACTTFISNFCEEGVEGFLGVSQFFGDNFLAAAVEGSAIKQTFTGRAGQTLSFAWNFLTDEFVGDNADPDNNDFAFATLTYNSQQLFFRLADTTSTLFSRTSRTPFFEETGFQTFSFNLTEDAEYTLGLGIVDVGETTVISGLLVDRVQAVPETSATLGLLFLGSLGAVSVLKRSQKKLTY